MTLDTDAATGARPDLGTPLLTASDLRVGFGRRRDRTDVVHGISFELARGECLALVGESGSGKSVTARTIVGLTGGDSQVSAGELNFDGTDLTRLRERDWRSLRGGRIGFVLQDALVSLDPVRTVGREITEALRLHTTMTKTEREERAVKLLADVGVPEPELRVRQLPHELSGGMRQRALIASAIACEPDLIIADEPTTALDVTVQQQVLDLLADLKSRGHTLLVISHDLAVVAHLADRVAVLNDGQIVETGPTEQVLFAPRHEYTKLLLTAVPAEQAKGTRLSAPAGAPTPLPERRPRDEVVARVDTVSKAFSGPDGRSRAAVRDVSFTLHAAETVGIVGESGSGKTTTARILLGLTEPDSGSVEVRGQQWTALGERERRTLRRDIQVIYQDPLSSFDPRHTVWHVLSEALGVAGVPRGAERRERAVRLLEQVGLGEEHLDRRPLRLSGGQRQRVAIARALAPQPKIIVCDEPVSSLDVSVQAQVLDLLADVQAETGVAYVFISHDLGVIYHVCDRVLVMKDGEVVEQGDVEPIFAAPTHPYTTELISAIPRLHDRIEAAS